MTKFNIKPTNRKHNMTKNITPLIESEVYKRDRWTCVYCGFDGRSFDSWMQLTLDHISPQHQKPDHSKENLVACCTSCNSITSRMKFEPKLSREKVLAEKLARVRERRAWYLERWKELVLPYVIEQSLPEAIKSNGEADLSEKV